MPAKKSGVGAIAPADLRDIGFALGGSYWQVDVANGTGDSKSQLTRYLNGERTPDYALSQKLKGMMIQRIEGLAPLFKRSPLPEHASAKTEKAIKLLLQACDLLKDGEAILPDWKPKPPKKRGGGQGRGTKPKKAKAEKATKPKARRAKAE